MKNENVVFSYRLLKKYLIITMAIILSFTYSPVYAINDAMLDLLKILVDKGSLTQGEYELLVNAAKADSEKTEGELKEVKEEVARKTESIPTFSTDKGKLEVASANGKFKFRVGGRLMTDMQINSTEVNGGNVNTEFRRARMYLSGVLDNVWKFKFQYDFTGNTVVSETGIKDAYLAYTGFKTVTITVGHKKVPFSLEELTSSKYITFIERSAPVNAMAIGRRYGITANGHFNNMLTAAASYHLSGAADSTADADNGLTGRLTFSPIHEKARAVHFGFSYDHSNSTDDAFGRVRARPEVHLGSRVVSTGAFAASDRDSYAIEAAGVYGPFSLQAEYSHQNFDNLVGSTAAVDIDGYYIYGSYFITGESRDYDWKSGAFKQTRVKNKLGNGGFGAWEVGARFAHGEYSNTVNGDSEADLLTLGLNWYPNNNIRLMANYITVLDGDDAVLGTTTGDADDADFFLMRAQWHF